jgi:CheY-like chemotaxis protein
MFRIYLPQMVAPAQESAVVQPVVEAVVKPKRPTKPAAPVAQPPTPGPPPFLPSRKETVLVVEDADVIRRLAHRILSSRGYQVLVASDGTDAMRVAEQHEGRIHLMLTDVVMPNMNGIELAHALSQARPDMQILFMSGYVPEASHGDSPMQHTLEKPFTAESLAAKVREVLRVGQTTGG